jgi:hypothetical protein
MKTSGYSINLPAILSASVFIGSLLTMINIEIAAAGCRNNNCGSSPSSNGRSRSGSGGGGRVPGSDAAQQIKDAQTPVLPQQGRKPQAPSLNR